MLSPNACQAKAEEILEAVHRARSQMAGQRVDPIQGVQMQLALQVEVATAQIWATLARKKQ